MWGQCLGSVASRRPSVSGVRGDDNPVGHTGHTPTSTGVRPGCAEHHTLVSSTLFIPCTVSVGDDDDCNVIRWSKLCPAGRPRTPGGCPHPNRLLLLGILAVHTPFPPHHTPGSCPEEFVQRACTGSLHKCTHPHPQKGTEQGQDGLAPCSSRDGKWLWEEEASWPRGSLL